MKDSRTKRRYQSAHWVLWLVLTGTGSLGLTAWADNEVFDARGFRANRDYFSQLPYEHVDPLTGNLLLTFTDLVLPGNAGFDLKIQRTYNSKIFKDYQTAGDTLDEDSWAGVGWTLHLGRVLNANDPVPGPIEMPDGSRHKLFLQNDGSGHFITRDFWVYDRTANPPLLLLPNGTKYTLNRSTSLFIGGVSVAVRYPTRIEDPFGNSFTISYMTAPVDGISSIVQDLGGGQSRTVTFGVTGLRNTLNTMTFTGAATTHQWIYTQTDANAVGFSLLTEVKPPVGPSWTYGYNVTGTPVSPCTVPSVHNELVRMTTPNGGQIDYIYCDKTFHLGSSVPVRTRSVIRRTTGGRGIAAGTWTYEYGPDLGGTENQSRITEPSSCGTITTTYTFMGVGNYSVQGNVWKIGLLQSRVRTDGVGPLETESFTWTPSAQISNDIETVGFNQDVGISVPLVSTRTVTRGTANYTTTNTYNGIGTCPAGGTHESYNDYGRACSISEQGQLSRKTDRLFQYGFTPYIKDRILSETVTVPTVGGESFAMSYTYNLTTGFKTGETIYGIAKTFAPDARGNLASVTDANSHTTAFSYDWGIEARVFTPRYGLVNPTISRVINQEGTIGSETRFQAIPGTGFTTTFQYDALFRQTSKAPPVGNGNAFITTYDNTGGAFLTVTRGPNSAALTSSLTTNLDGFGRVSGTNNSLNIQTTTTYDACGRRSYESYPQLGVPDTIHGMSYQYDALNRTTRKTNNADSPPSFVSYTFDRSLTGINVDIRDENAHVTQQTWNAFGDPSDARLKTVTDANSKQWQYSYNALGRLTQVLEPLSIVRQWSYNTKNQLASEKHPEMNNASTCVGGVSICYSYFPAGQLQTRTDAQFGQTSYGYDANDRLTSITRPAAWSAYSASLDYDASDNRTLLSNGYAASTFGYDGANRLRTRTDTVGGANYTTTYVPDGNDFLREIDYASGNKAVYTPDSESRITQVTNGVATTYASNIHYHPSGDIKDYLLGNNLLQQITLDERYRFKDLFLGFTDLGIQRRLTYGYDFVSNVTSISDTRAGYSRVFGYDALDRLNTAQGIWGSGTYGYADVGNRSTSSVGTSATYSYDPSTNRLSSYTGSSTLGYDLNGNTTTDGIGGTYVYTPDNMVQTATVGGNTTTYRYDGDDLRKIKIEPSAINHHYVHGPGNQILSEYANPCALQPVALVREYVYVGTRVLASVRPSAVTTTVAFAAAASSVGEVAASATVGVTVTTSNGQPTSCPVSVAYATADGTALAGADYTATSGAVSFLAGTASGGVSNVSVPIINDTLNENNETFTIMLSNASGAVLASPSIHTVTILDDDPLPSISINDVSVTEGNSGTTNAVFTVSLSAASGRTVTVNYATAGNTATSGTDFQPVSGTLTFTAGMTSLTVAVPVIGDLIDEDNETFFVNLSGATNATIAGAQGIGTIIDDDPAPTISIANCAAVEGDSGTSPCAFHVSLSAPSSRIITVAYATADGTAIAGPDYVTASGTLTFNPGVSTQDAIVSIVGDATNESNKTYLVNLSGPTNATIAQGQATGTITDNDITSFFTVAPCRIIDTGGAPGPSGGPAMAANTTRIFPAAGLCGIPTTAKAVAVIVTTTVQTDFGDLRVYHADGALPGATTINFAVDHARANNAIVPLGTAGQISVTCDMPPGSTGTTRLIVDVYGYFQ